MGTRILQVANFYSRHSGGLRTTVDALGRAYVGAGFERVLVVPGPADADEDTPAGRRITLRSPKLPGSGGYRALAGTGAVRAVLAELPPDHLEVSDKLTLVGLGQWATRNGLPRRACLARAARRDPLAEGPAGLPAGRVRRLVEPPRGTRLQHGGQPVAGPRAVEFTRIGATDVSVVPSASTSTSSIHTLASNQQTPTATTTRSGSCASAGSRERSGRLWQSRCSTPCEHAAFPLGSGWSVTGPARVALEKKARGLPVVFTGHLQDRHELARLLAHAHAALAPCPYETFGLAALEALACGTPVVAADRGAVPELVQAVHFSATGAVATPDPPSLAAAVHDVVRTHRDRARRASRDRAEQYPSGRAPRARCCGSTERHEPVHTVAVVHGRARAPAAGFRATIALGHPVSLGADFDAALRPYERLCLEWYLHTAHEQTCVLRDGDRVVGYTLRMPRPRGLRPNGSNAPAPASRRRSCRACWRAGTRPRSGASTGSGSGTDGISGATPRTESPASHTHT